MGRKGRVVVAPPALKRFADATASEEALAALAALSKRRASADLTTDSLFARGFARLCELVGPLDEVAKLQATAELGRCLSRLPRLPQGLLQTLRATYHSPIPSLSSLRGAAARRHVIVTLRSAAPAWATSYLARQAAEPKTPAVVSRDATNAVLVLAGSLAGAVAAVGDALKGRLPSRPPADLKVLQRALAFLADATGALCPSVGAGLGRQVRALLRDESRRVTGTNRSLLGPVAEAGCQLLLAALQVRPSLSLTEDLPIGLEAIREWLGDESLEEFSAGAAPLAALELQLREIITVALLSEQPSPELVRAWKVILSSEPRFASARAELVRRYPGISDSRRDWLFERRLTKAAGDMAESQWRKADQLLGDVLIAVDAMKGELETSAPKQTGSERRGAASEGVRTRLTGTAATTATAVERLARHRMMSLSNKVGTRAAFSPLEYATSGQPMGLGQLGRVESPAVVAANPDGTTRVVLKGVMVPIEEAQEDGITS